MSKVFANFDTNGDGALDFGEFQRAFRAIGLKKRDGSKYDVDMEVCALAFPSPPLLAPFLFAFPSLPLLSPPLTFACLLSLVTSQMFKSFDANGRRCSVPVMRS